LKSFVRKDGGDQKEVQPAKDDDQGNPSVDFWGENPAEETTARPNQNFTCWRCCRCSIGDSPPIVLKTWLKWGSDWKPTSKAISLTR